MENESLPHPPVELLDLATGYQRSKTLFALVEFGLPTVLAGRTLSLDQIARSLGIHQIAADRFLNACVALRLLDRAGTNFSNTVLSETFLEAKQHRDKRAGASVIQDPPAENNCAAIG